MIKKSWTVPNLAVIAFAHNRISPSRDIRLWEMRFSNKSERRFVRTHWLQEVLGLSEVLWVMTVLFVGKCEFRFRRFKKASRALATRAKARLWIRTGNLPIVQRNDLTTEPRLQIWHIRLRIIAIIKSNCKKKFTTRKTCWIAVWLLANSGAESLVENWTWQL